MAFVLQLYSYSCAIPVLSFLLIYDFFLLLDKSLKLVYNFTSRGGCLDVHLALPYKFFLSFILFDGCINPCWVICQEIFAIKEFACIKMAS